MPVVSINRTPAIPEGEHAGTIEKVASGFTKAGAPRFSFTIKMKDGTTLKDSLGFSENVIWRIDQICKSAELLPPENGAPFNLTTDDLEGRRVYFGVKYNPAENGRVFTNINYHTVAYALGQNPALAGLFPPQTPRKLREAPPEDGQGGVEPTPSATTPNPTPAKPVGAAVGVEEAEDDGLTPEEYAEALEQVRRNKLGKVPA